MCNLEYLRKLSRGHPALVDWSRKVDIADSRFRLPLPYRLGPEQRYPVIWTGGGVSPV